MPSTMSRYAERRQALMAQLKGGVAVLASAPVAIRNNDVEHEYRQDSDFFYLTGFDEPDSVLVLASAHAEHHMVLFVRPRDPEREVWDGARAGVEGAVRDFGADAAFPMNELATRLPDTFTDICLPSTMNGQCANGASGRSRIRQLCEDSCDGCIGFPCVAQ